MNTSLNKRRNRQIRKFLFLLGYGAVAIQKIALAGISFENSKERNCRLFKNSILEDI